MNTDERQQIYPLYAADMLLTLVVVLFWGAVLLGLWIWAVVALMAAGAAAEAAALVSLSFMAVYSSFLPAEPFRKWWRERPWNDKEAGR